ncbi:MAG: hypothetical protein ACE5R6_21560 [Candidatus Heimdallarchaeota archaeon]
MKYQLYSSHPSHLPIKRDLTLAYVLSLVGAILMVAVSLGGLLYPSTFYPTSDLLQSFVANDLVNLFVGPLILFGSMWLTRRGKLVGLLFWPGALLYVIYNYIAYIFGTPFSLFTFTYLVLVLLSTYNILDLLKSIDKKSVQERLSEGVPVKTSGWVLVVFGVLFTFRAIGMIAEASTNQTMLPISEIGVLIADIFMSILWIAGGVLLLRRRPLGYVGGLGLLFAASILFISLIMFLLLQPFLTDAPFVLVDIIVVFIMGLICFIPFGLFVRKVVSKEKSS